MIVEIRMPEVAADMTEADVVGWLAAEGDPINEGEILFEIETDKSTVEIEAPATGILKEIRVPAGQAGVAVGELLAVIETAEKAVVEDIEVPSATEPEPVEPPIQKPDTATLEEDDPKDQPEATALARRIAQKAGLDVTEIRGTGARGRVLRADVEETLAEGTAPFKAETHTIPSDAAPAPGLSATDPIHLSTACRFDLLLQAITTLNRGNPDPPIPASAGLVRAIAMAVHRVGLPETSRPAGEEQLTRLSITDGSDSSTSVILGAERRGLGSIAAELASPEPPAASISGESEEVAVFHALESGVDRIEARLHAGQICSFSIGTVRESPVVESGTLVTGTLIEINLCADSRLYTAEAATLLLGGVRQLLESPTQMVL